MRHHSPFESARAHRVDDGDTGGSGAADNGLSYGEMSVAGIMTGVPSALARQPFDRCVRVCVHACTGMLVCLELGPAPCLWTRVPALCSAVACLPAARATLVRRLT